ncbi:hypothetical protein A6V36_23725 [Paraburkholderia ginsengiterrae]|uniref:Uncharacterized protein n=1 Tax=Paraburkholderia ginsengiterrae TaxID=1462993 RepID=A0A1A9NGW4_9BURK|nr:hypothetical protein A6V36_23725 [Paraburkholderia ginsengiterrae]OAJ65358.1 hypothetical protein A6V37_15480 [Paraburkholderia ginsengiterrae]
MGNEFVISFQSKTTDREALLTSEQMYYAVSGLWSSGPTQNRVILSQRPGYGLAQEIHEVRSESTTFT